eukprot:snap_masked-scaffold_11-processed-gene-3.22-mRNA-1 protein AED:1.00 eAED:1.00 QI:0/-1/0/0/-1/1/1/0/67
MVDLGLLLTEKSNLELDFAVLSPVAFKQPRRQPLRDSSKSKARYRKSYNFFIQVGKKNSSKSSFYVK